MPDKIEPKLAPLKRREPTDQELRMWAVEQSVKWRAGGNRSGMSSDAVANAYYQYAKNGGDLNFEEPKDE